MLTAESSDLIERLTRERDTAQSQLAFYAHRERDFASMLAIADGGQYRADWEAAIRRVVADRDAARAERDAILQWLIKHASYIGIGTRCDDGQGSWWARGDDGNVCGRTAEEAVRKAAGLDGEAS